MTDPRQEGNRLKPYTTYLVTLMPLKVELRRRYSDFDALRETLLRRYPAILLNPLPPKKAVNNTSEETVLLRMRALEKWLNDAVRIPYIRMDATVRDFISVPSMNWGRVPEKDSLCLHNAEPKVGAARGREAQSKKDRVENEGFDHYQAFMTHVKCAEEVEACA